MQSCHIHVSNLSQYQKYLYIAGGFEVNFMDDVGQTLLNWASAFGTLEMVGHVISSCSL